jgi:Holliday junction resolvase RusA-like endonuclease
MNRAELPIILTLPRPPSVNNLFSTIGRKRVTSKRYKEWQTEAGWELQRQRPGRITGEWQCDIALPIGTVADLDNLAKPILDLLVTHEVVPDDKFCTRLTVAKAKTLGRCIITVRAA